MPPAGHYLNSITSPVLTDQQKPGLLLFQNNKLTTMIKINLAPGTGKISRRQHKADPGSGKARRTDLCPS